MWRCFWQRKEDPKSAPAFWLTYQILMDQGFDRRQPVEEAFFVVLDTETTGLNTRKDRILSIGAVQVHHWQIDLSASFDYLVEQPEHRGGSRSIPIHGILPVERNHSLTEAQAIQAFIEFAGNAILVGHHVQFDIAMINQALRRLGLDQLRNKYLDTAQLANRLMGAHHPGPRRTPGLDELCRQYGIATWDRHTAAGDAYLTAILFMKLLAKLKKRRVRNLGDLLR